MSLMSLLTTNTSSQSSLYDSGTTASLTVQQILALQSADTTASSVGSVTSSDTSNGVSISDAAKAAAAETADNAKDFNTLATDVRATLDQQYAAAKAAGATTTPAPDLSGMSGRALAAIVLNPNGNFTPAESTAAKAALRNDMRSDFVSATSTYGTSISALSSYSQQLVSQYDAMSAEERQARGWTSQFRASNANFVSEAATPGLFDQLGD